MLLLFDQINFYYFLENNYVLLSTDLFLSNHAKSDKTKDRVCDVRPTDSMNKNENEEV